MRNRRTKAELEKLTTAVFYLLKQGFEPHAIHKKTGERRDLIDGIIARIIEDHREIDFQLKVVAGSKTLSQLAGDGASEFFKVEKDEFGAMILIPVE